MRLKKYTDYALRVLIIAASKSAGELTSIKEIAETFEISTEHVRKIVHQLNKLEYIHTIRGRNGGIQLAQSPEQICVGQVVREMENDFVLMECFDAEGNQCVLLPKCKLKHALNKALQAFLHVLDDYTLADLIVNKQDLRALLALE
ncbi:Rrf2 family transcriptional regulator [Aquibacillus sediminis]|uniref:Rrf2 family transcriptional regulator n=1 Tax=Aquibacillus sediminis TaxID=2574734 RepID=UPI001108540A|nr:Rrf2 family transcriptional regulator [Aquibacillus sediminis]